LGLNLKLKKVGFWYHAYKFDDDLIHKYDLTMETTKIVMVRWKKS